MQTGPMWLLRSSSAKKINKPFDHKGPIHSLSPSASLFLSLSLSLSPLPPPLIHGSFSSALLCFFKFFYCCPSSHSFFIFLSYPQVCPPALAERQEQQRDRHHPTSQGADRQTDGHRHRQGPPYSTNTVMVQSRGTQHGKCLHHSVFCTKTRTGTREKNFPLRPLSAVTNTLAASFRLDN